MTCILCQTGLGMAKRKATYDESVLRCYRCHDSYDRAIAEGEYGGQCPRCSHKMRPARDGWRWVCIKCGDPL